MRPGAVHRCQQDKPDLYPHQTAQVIIPSLPGGALKAVQGIHQVHQEDHLPTAVEDILPEVIRPDPLPVVRDPHQVHLHHLHHPDLHPEAHLTVEGARVKNF